MKTDGPGNEINRQSRCCQLIESAGSDRFLTQRSFMYENILRVQSLNYLHGTMCYQKSGLQLYLFREEIVDA